MIYQLDAPKDCLEQGDVLEKTEDLHNLLTKYHPYYATHENNKFFAVLTQSCDLMRRGGGCNARYISLAPIRPLSVILKREFEGKLDNVGLGAQPFTTHRVRSSLEQFLQRLFNNNEPPFFYYEALHENGIYEEMCALLSLPVSVKPEHYETLRQAKLAGITDVFQAKLGWLLGQMYSRVGTPDFEPKTISKKLKDYIEGVALWLDDSEAKALSSLIDARKAAGNTTAVGPQELHELIQKIPKRKTQAIDAILNLVASQGLVGEVSPERRRLRQALEKDPAFAKVFA